MLNKARLRFRLSASGKTLLFLAIFLLLAAQNTGNNLLYLMSSCFFSCLIVSGILSLRNLAGLKVDLLLPDYCFAGEDTILRCRIEDRLGRIHRCIGFEEDYLACLEPGSIAIMKTSFRVAARGQFLVKQFRLFSCYPVDIFLTSLELPSDALAVGPVPARLIPELLARDTGGAIQKQSNGKEGDYWMQSHYQEGEDASLINWKISARSFHEWVLIKSVNLGSTNRLFFDFSGLSPERFEASLQIVAGLLLKMRNQPNETFVWANSFRRGYMWVSLQHDMPKIVRWLACLTKAEEQPVAEGSSEAIKISQWVAQA